jgi:hypothetical protein
MVQESRPHICTSFLSHLSSIFFENSPEAQGVNEEWEDPELILRLKPRGWGFGPAPTASPTACFPCVNFSLHNLEPTELKIGFVK